jgi:hypothetical protein
MPSIFYRRDEPLFDEKNIIDDHPKDAAVLRKRLKAKITEDGCPPEQFERLGL